jgi:hypothetical protein
VEFLKILALCIVGSVVYGVLHDVVTIHVCPEYFTLYHPKVFATSNLWLLALGWGVIATWWMGAFFGVLVAAAAQTGTMPKLYAAKLVKPLVILLGICYVLAAFAGVVAYTAGPGMRNSVVNALIPVTDLPDSLVSDRPFMTDYIAHNVSYTSSAIGALLLCGWIIRQRIRLRAINFPPHELS